MNRRGSSPIVVLVGVLFIIVGVIIVVFTATGVMDQAIHFEFIPALKGYIIGAICSIIFIVIGFLILIFGLRGS